MADKKQNVVRKGGRWLRVGLLTLTMAGPVVNTFLKQARLRFPSTRTQIKAARKTSRNTQQTAKRLGELSQGSRQRAAKQVVLLQQQSRQLQRQARQLRKALRNEAKQRRKLQKATKQLRKSGIELTEGLLAQGGKISHDLLERGSNVTQNLTGRSSQITSDLVRRGNKASRELAKQAGKMTDDLTDRTRKLSQKVIAQTQQVIKPEAKRRRNNIFWSIFGFSIGLVIAGLVTYWFVRRQMYSQDMEEDQQIELPQMPHMNGAATTTNTNRPLGEIHHLDPDSSSIATLPTIEVETDEIVIPENAAFVGVMSTKRYYSIDVMPEVEAIDVLYFITEEEALKLGFLADEEQG